MATSEQEVKPSYSDSTARAVEPTAFEPALRPVRGIIRAKLAVMEEVFGVRKDRVNKHQNYEYTGHDDVTEALREAFVKYGISQKVSVKSAQRSPDGQLLAILVDITWTSLEDDSEETVTTYGESTTKNKSGRPDSVEFGQALSYAVKCAQLKNFMLVGGLEGGDPEEQHGREETPARREEKRSDPPKKSNSSVSDAEVNGWIGSYEKVTTQKELDETRQKMMRVVKLVSDEQRDRLGEADERAALRINDNVNIP